METIELSVELRERTGKSAASKARQAGLIPAVLYGAGGPPKTLALNDAVFQKILRGTGNKFTLFNLKVKEGTGEHAEAAMIKAIQRHPVSEAVIHVDFMRVSLKEKITAEVPVLIEGTSPGVKLGGVLQQAGRYIRVKCLPAAVPGSIVADVSALNIGGVISAGDLKLPEGVELQTDSSATILSIVAIRLEEEAPAAEAAPEAVAAAETAAQPEVIGEKERDERRLKKEEEVTAREAEKKEIKETRKKEEKPK